MDGVSKMRLVRAPIALMVITAGLVGVVAQSPATSAEEIICDRDSDQLISICIDAGDPVAEQVTAAELEDTGEEFCVALSLCVPVVEPVLEEKDITLVNANVYAAIHPDELCDIRCPPDLGLIDIPRDLPPGTSSSTADPVGGGDVDGDGHLDGVVFQVQDEYYFAPFDVWA